jgi:hypothetical protein
VDKNAILVALSQSDRTAFGKQDFEKQSEPQKVFSAIWEVESEVNNGGFTQYFENLSCGSAKFVTKALELLGAPKTADICRRAIACAFPEGLPEDPDAIGAAACEFSEATTDSLGELDQEFYSYPHDLTELLFDYVSKHPEEFGTVS